MASLFFLYFLLFLLPLYPVHTYPQCPVFFCGSLGEVGFPFINTTGSGGDCGSIILNCSDETAPKVQFHDQGKWYLVKKFHYFRKIIIITDSELQSHLEFNRCESLSNITDVLVASSSFKYSFKTPSFPFFKCKKKAQIPHHLFPPETRAKKFKGCTDDYELYFPEEDNSILPCLHGSLSNICSTVQLPKPLSWDTNETVLEDEDPIEVASGWNPRNESITNLTSLWGATYILEWVIQPHCGQCLFQGGSCPEHQNGTFQCGSFKVTGKDNKGKDDKGKKIAIGMGTGLGGVLLACSVLFIYQRCKKVHSTSPTNMSWSSSSQQSLKQDIERGGMSLPAPIFTHDELEEATNNFHPSQELGDGGFGTVYRGRLRDGRVVAVKRLYKNNYKRVEKFMNEVTILSHLRHPNLVALYGCTSRHSRELLLVYEFVPNGTVGDHLHGDRANVGLLTWPIRMTIAIETAEALTYLHASDIIHRDVKTNNILLDNHFHVKVADFGLSRLFPSDVTHVSTAPQGTPGYVDPEYYQCYQLNDRSDVYSFGVVLIELISSKPAVDISRLRHEINLASMAMNKILNNALHELVDPSTGFESDYGVRRMVTLVAELAFRCLQHDRELRPCMKEVLDCLKEIESKLRKQRTEEAEELDIPAKTKASNNTLPFSPYTGKDEQDSTSSTSNGD